MWSITLKLMRKTKRMLIPAGIAIMIGTAFIASTFLFGNAMNDSLTRQMTAMFGNANYAVTVNSSDLSDEELNEAYPSTVGDFHLDQIAGIEGVDGVRASVNRFAQPATSGAVQVMPAGLGRRAEIVGAAQLAGIHARA